MLPLGAIRPEMNSWPAYCSFMGDPEGDAQDARRFSMRHGCLIEKFRARFGWQI